MLRIVRNASRLGFVGLASVPLFVLILHCQGEPPPAAGNVNAVKQCTIDVDDYIRSDEEFTSLVTEIRTTIAPTSWKERGGSGLLTVDVKQRSITVRNTSNIVEEVLDLLEARENRIPDFSAREAARSQLKSVALMADILAKYAQIRPLASQLEYGDPSKSHPEKTLVRWQIVAQTGVDVLEVRGRIDRLFTDLTNYSGGEAPMCFEPGLALTWVKKGKRTDVLVCLKCRQIETYEDGKVTGWCLLSPKGVEECTKLYKQLFPIAGNNTPKRSGS